MTKAKGGTETSPTPPNKNPTAHLTAEVRQGGTGFGRRSWKSPGWDDPDFTRAWAIQWVTSTARTRWPDHPVTDERWVDSICAWVLAA